MKISKVNLKYSFAPAAIYLYNYENTMCAQVYLSDVFNHEKSNFKENTL